MVRPNPTRVALVMLAAAGVLAAGPPARAEFVSGFTGPTLLANQPDGAFADSNLFSAGVDGGGLDLGATLVPLFQVTNSNVDPSQAEGAIQSPWVGGFTSGSVPGDMTFTDDSVNVVATKGQFLADDWDPEPPSEGDIPQPSPEPGTLLLAAATLPGLLLVRRRKRAVA